MEKVKVNKEVFDALESYKARSGNRFKEFLNYDVCTDNDLSEEEQILRNLELSKLVDIAYCGYELEETKEQKLKRYYNTNNNLRLLLSSREEMIYKQGIIDCYETLEGKKFSF